MLHLQHLLGVDEMPTVPLDVTRTRKPRVPHGYWLMPRGVPMIAVATMSLGQMHNTLIAHRIGHPSRWIREN